MSKRDHPAIVLDIIKGLFARRGVLLPPNGYLVDATNLQFNPLPTGVESIFTNQILRSRESFILEATLTGALTGYRKFHFYNGRILYSIDSGILKDFTAGTTIATTGGAGSHHRGLTLNGRFYFTPVTTGGGYTGSSGEFIYVYDPSLSATARKIAGTKPGAGMLAAAGAAGVIEPGKHVYAVSFITNTGFITKPGSHVALVTAAASTKTALTVIPTGGSFVVKRRLWMSKVVREHDGNLTTVPLFFIGDINDNVTTTATLDAYDSQLISSADPYMDLLEEVPAGAFLTMFDDRLVSCGESANPYIVRISNQNEPEAFDSVDGLREINKYDNAAFGGVTTTRSLRGNLHCWKVDRTYVLKPNGLIPAEWEIEIIDTTLGASPESISEILGDSNPYNDLLLVGNPSGLYLYDGGYTNQLFPLSYNIEPLWRSNARDPLDYNTGMKIRIDPQNFRLYAIMPQYLHSSAESGIFYGDFSDGLSYDKIKWSIWTPSFIDIHVYNPLSGIASPTLYALKFTGGKLVKLDQGTIGEGEDWDATRPAIRASFITCNKELDIIHCAGVRGWLVGDGVNNNYNFGVKSYFNGVATPNLLSIILPTPMRMIEKLFNVQGHMLEISVEKASGVKGYMSLGALMAYVKSVYQEQPM
jgi:hypothetical protein